MKRESFVLDRWTEKNYGSLVAYLKRQADEAYRQFSEKLIPEGEPMFGVRMPLLRKLGKQISQGNYEEYLALCKNDSFEEIVLRGIVIGLLPVGFEELCALTDDYIPAVKNWASCDYFCGGLKRVKRFRKEFFPKIQKYLVSENPWERRVGLVLLRAHYVTEEYVGQILSLAQNASCEHYYVQMAHAWLIAECYTKFPERTYRYLQNAKLSSEILNKAIRKIRDSYRVDEDWKEKASFLKRS